MASPISFKEPPEAVCVIRLSAIGDTCHTVPVVRALQAAWPGTAVTWIIGKVEHGLLAGLDGVEFVVLDKGRGLAGYREVRRKLAGRRFPLLLHMHPSLRANVVSAFVSADIRLGFDRARARDHQWLFCNAQIPAREREHVMDSLFGFATAVGVARGPLRWDIPLSAEDRQFAARAIDGTQPVVLMSPCAVQRFRNYRNWNPVRYAAVADYAARRYGARTILTGGSTAIEQSYAQEIAAHAATPVTNLIGQTTLKQLLALIERATTVVCSDSGPAHMASAVATPVVGLYATTNRHRAGPYLSQHLVVDKYPVAVEREFGKRVEEMRWGTRVRNPNAMDLIEVDDVTAKLDLAFAERGVAQIAQTTDRTAADAKV